MRRAVVSTLLAAIAGTAHADPDDFVARPLVLARGEVEAEATLEVNLTKGTAFVPLSLAPDLWVGITPQLTLGLIHGDRSLDQIGAGGSFCVRRSPETCDRTYLGSGLDARWNVRSGPLAIAPRARLLLRDLEPAKPAVTVGALVRWTRGRFAIVGDPYLRLGLANLDRGNRAALVLPVWLQVQPTCRWLVALHLGWDSDLAVVRDGWHFPVGVVAGVHPYRALELDLEFGFPSLLGPQNDGGNRALLLTAGWRQ